MQMNNNSNKHSSSKILINNQGGDILRLAMEKLHGPFPQVAVRFPIPLLCEGDRFTKLWTRTAMIISKLLFRGIEIGEFYLGD